MSQNRYRKRQLAEREALDWKAKTPGRKARCRDFLTDEFVASLPARASEYAVRDIECRAFGVRVRPTGTKTYFLRPLNRGTKKLISLGHSEEILTAEARGKARSIERRLANGGSVAEFSSPSTTRRFEDAFRVYIAGWGGTPTWRQKIERTFDHDIIPHLGHMLLTDLRVEDFKAVLAYCRSSYGRKQQRYMASAFLTWCTKTGRVRTNVLKGLPASPRPRPSRNPVELDAYELELIWDACDLLPEKWTQALRLVIVLAEPIDSVLKLDADGRSSPEGPVHQHLRSRSFAREYFTHISDGREGLLFIGRDKRSPMQFQSRIVEFIRAELHWLRRFSMGDIVQASSRHLTALRQPGAEWNELHPRAVTFKDASPSVDDDVQI